MGHCRHSISCHIGLYADDYIKTYKEKYPVTMGAVLHMKTNSAMCIASHGKRAVSISL